MIDANIAMLEVVVENGRWNAYGDGSESSVEAYNILVSQGGINESVPEGTYVYTVERISNTSCLVSLYPKED